MSWSSVSNNDKLVTHTNERGDEITFAGEQLISIKYKGDYGSNYPLTTTSLEEVKRMIDDDDIDAINTTFEI